MRWGDKAGFTVQRGEAEVDLEVEFRRVEEEAEESGGEAGAADKDQAHVMPKPLTEAMPPAEMMKRAKEKAQEGADGGSH
jgi:hypothetical protein